MLAAIIIVAVKQPAYIITTHRCSFISVLLVFDSDGGGKPCCNGVTTSAGDISGCGIWMSCPGDSVIGHTHSCMLAIQEEEK